MTPSTRRYATAICSCRFVPIPDTVIHALRDIIKHTPDLLSVRWKREGFISDHAARSKGKETPVNLLGFKDGTATRTAAMRR